MVVVHEFGHFLVAKLCRVRVEQFSIGFPPRLFGIKIGETDYCVSALPLGGYVKMTGESMPGENMSLEGAAPDQIEAQKADPGALTSHPRWQRILIGLAGPAANFVLAFVLMVVYFGWINEVPKYVVNSTTVEWIVPGSAAAQAGLKTGDVIQRFDTVDNPDWMQVAAQSTLNLGQTVQLTVERAGVPDAAFAQHSQSAKGPRLRLSGCRHSAAEESRAHQCGGREPWHSRGAGWPGGWR